MYSYGIGLRNIERITNVHHTTVLRWVREAQAKPSISEDFCGSELTE
jgi:transposase-like protein